MNNEEEFTYEFYKNSHELVRAGISTYNGRKYVFLRIFYNASADPENPEWHPSKKGVTIGIHYVDELVKAVNSIKEKLS